MIGLALPAIDAENELKRATKRGNARPLRVRVNQLLASYDTYSNNATDLRTMNPIAIPVKAQDRLRRLCSRLAGKGPLGRMGDAILASTVLCPSCQLNEVSELDHHLPKSVFPEFSIFHANLIPLCGVCNRAKGDDRSGLYFHNYFDRVPRATYLRCSVVSKPGAVIVRYQLLFSDPQSLVALKISNQVTNLDLLDRFRIMAVDWISRHDSTLAQLRTNLGEAGLLASLEEKKNEEIVAYGHNYWKTALLKGLLRSQSFVSGQHRQMATVSQSDGV